MKDFKKDLIDWAEAMNVNPAMGKIIRSYEMGEINLCTAVNQMMLQTCNITEEYDGDIILATEGLKHFLMIHPEVTLDDNGLIVMVSMYDRTSKNPIFVVWHTALKDNFAGRTYNLIPFAIEDARSRGYDMPAAENSNFLLFEDLEELSKYGKNGNVLTFDEIGVLDKLKDSSDFCEHRRAILTLVLKMNMYEAPFSMLEKIMCTEIPDTDDQNYIEEIVDDFIDGLDPTNDEQLVKFVEMMEE